jgi:hypothetical protein
LTRLLDSRLHDIRNIRDIRTESIGYDLHQSLAIRHISQRSTFSVGSSPSSEAKLKVVGPPAGAPHRSRHFAGFLGCCHALLRADAHRESSAIYHASFLIMSKHSPASAVSDGQEVWSDESGNEEAEPGSSKKRRRTITERPISVSCETCMSHATVTQVPFAPLLTHLSRQVSKG